MKRILMVVIAMTIAGQVTFAQDRKDVNPDKKSTRPTEEQMQAAALGVLQYELCLSDEVSTKFAAMYKQYVEELKATCKKPEYKKSEQLSGAQEKSRLLELFDNIICTTNIRKQYVSKFSTILTDKQVCKFFDVERKLMSRARAEMERREDDHNFPHDREK